MSEGRIEVFADVACPFTHVGLRRFVARRGPGPPDLWVRGWPLEVVNGEPLAPAFVAEEVEALRRQVAPDLFAGFDVARFPASSLPAMALAHAAYERGMAEGEAVSLELRDLLFERGEDVADPEVLARVAERHALDGAELDPAPVLRDRSEGEQRGVEGSPYWITGAGGFFCPSLEIQRDGGGRLHIVSEPSAFDAFVETALRSPG